MKKNIVLMIIVIILVLVLGFTSGYMFYKFSAKNINISGEKAENVTSSSEVKNVDEVKLDDEDSKYVIQKLTDKYAINNITTEEVKYQEGEPYVENNSTVYPIVVQYLKINGLKNKEIENKVNEQIKEHAFNLLPKDKDYENLNIYTYVSGNFSNILSISFGLTKKVKLDPTNPKFNSDWSYEYISYSTGLNINLVDGSKIELKDLFVKNFDYKSIIVDELYSTLAFDYNGTWDYEKDEYIEPDRSSLEERYFAYRYQLMKDNLEFNFSPDYLNIIINNPGDPITTSKQVMTGLSFQKYYKNVTIFNKYLTQNSLYENGESSDKRYYFMSDYEMNKIHDDKDNLFMYFSPDNLYVDEYKTLYAEWVNGRENAEKEYASQHKDRQIIEFFEVNYQYLENFDITNVDVLRYEIPKSKYTEELKEKIFSAIRAPYEYYEEEDYFDVSIVSIIEKIMKELNVEVIDSVHGKNGIYLRNERIYDENGNYDFNRVFDHDEFFILPSDERLINEEEIANMDLTTVTRAYNEIFARYGHDFANKELRNYFLGQVWYAMIPDKKVTVEELSEIEQKNVEILRNRMYSLNGGN